MTNNPATMDQDACDRLLAAEHEGLRTDCACVKGDTACQDCWTYNRDSSSPWSHSDRCSGFNCHGNGYVPKVDLEGLMVAMDLAGWRPGAVYSSGDAKVWEWKRLVGWVHYERYMQDGPTYLLAASRAAVAARQEAS